MNIKKKYTAMVLSVLIAVAMVVIIPVKSVKADTVTTVVMTYDDKTYTRQLYGPDTDQIKNGVVTDGLKSIGEQCDNLKFQTNGECEVDRNAVMDAVKAEVIAGNTSINIDLKKYTPQAIAAVSQSVATNTASLANAVADTGSASTIVASATVADPVINATLNSIGIDCKISEATTKFNPNQDRAVNVRTAASKINGLILLPGQGISANLAFGPRTVANGYGMGNVISGGTYVKALGGGICQVSSTLNLAVLRAGIIPTERHNHSHRSNYIGSGLDATISAGTLDYQFINTLAYPIYISTSSAGGVLTVSIYSNHDALAGVVYEPNVVGGSMSNTTYLIGTLNGVQISNRRAYSSKYAQ